MSKIESGPLLSKIGKFLNQFSSALSKGMSKLVEYGLDVDESKFQRTEDGGFKFFATTGAGTVLKVKCVPVPEKKGYYNVYVRAKTGERKDYPMVPEAQFDDKILDFIDSVLKEESGLENNFDDAKWEGRANDERADVDVNESKHLKVTLRRVTASKSDNIELMSVYANYLPSEALVDLKTVVQDDEFCNSLGETPCSYEITPTEDNYCIEKIASEELCTEGTLPILLSCAYNTLLNLQTIHWNVAGKQFMRIHVMMDEYLENIREQIDRIAEITLETDASIMNPLKIIKNYGCPVVPDTNFDGIEGARLAKETICQFLDALELYYPNVPHQVQSEYDEWIGYWRTEALFKLSRIF